MGENSISVRQEVECVGGESAVYLRVPIVKQQVGRHNFVIFLVDK